MTLHRFVAFGLALALVLPLASAQDAGEDGAPEWELIASDLAYPVDLVFAPDGSLYYAELNSGNVRVIQPGASAPDPEPVARVDASPGGNGGFLGLELAPDFHTSGVMYAYYTTQEGGEKWNRVSRLTADRETVLLDRIPWAEMHDGGRLLFMPDGKLLATTGDNERRDPAQDDDSLLGKVLRLNPDGSVPDDNPVDGKPWTAKGVRNPFGLCRDTSTGDVWFTDNGPGHGDELNKLRTGGNYGWPHAVGTEAHDGYDAPAAAWERTFGPTGCAALDGRVYVGDFNMGQVRVYDAETGEDGVLASLEGRERVLDVEAGPDDALYVSTYTNLYRLALPDSSPRPTEPVDVPDDDGAGGNGTDPGNEDPGDGNGASYQGNDTDGNATDDDPDEVGGEQETPGPGLLVALVALAAAGAAWRKNPTRTPRKRNR